MIFSEFWQSQEDSLRADDLVLVPDRALTPAGLRNLCESRTHWPNPGVFGLSAFAERILIEEERLTQRRLFLRSRAELPWKLRLLVDSFPRDLEVFEAHQILLRSQRLQPFGLSPHELQTLIEELEADTLGSELTPWSEAALTQLLLQLASPTEGRRLSDWELMSEAAALLLKSPLPYVWSRIGEQSPAQSTEKPRLILLDTAELWPVEEVFVQRLAQHLSLQRVSEALSGDPWSEEELSSLPKTKVIDPGSTVLWASTSTAPGRIELSAFIPGDSSLRAPLAPAMRIPPQQNLFKALWLAADWVDSGRPNNHAYLQGPRSRELLEESGFASFFDEKACPRGTFFLRLFELDHRLMDAFGGIPEKGRISDWICIATQWLASKEETLTPLPRLQPSEPRSITILDFMDGGLSNTNSYYLLGSPQELQTRIDPQSEETLKARLLPSRVESHLASLGRQTPDPSREAIRRGQWLRVMKPRLSWLIPHEAFSPTSTSAPGTDMTLRDSSINSQSVRSPSGLEDYHRCPYYFYLNRVLRPKEATEWDPIEGNALKEGIWLHDVLRRLFETGLDWNDLKNQVQSLFLETRSEHFRDIASPSYLEVLGQKASDLTRRLVPHLISFEKGLLEWRESKASLCEVEVSGFIEGFRLKGQVDRIDLLSHGRALLWDYKSGKQSSLVPETQIRNGKFQWFLYKNLLEAKALPNLPHPLRVVGGGYLNPLDPLKSSLFIDETDSEALRLGEFFRLMRHPVRALPSEDLLKETLAVLHQNLESNLVTPRPRHDSECERCPYRGPCGRPYLKTKKVGS